MSPVTCHQRCVKSVKLEVVQVRSWNLCLLQHRSTMLLWRLRYAIGGWQMKASKTTRQSTTVAVVVGMQNLLSWRMSCLNFSRKNVQPSSKWVVVDYRKRLRNWSRSCLLTERTLAANPSLHQTAGLTESWPITNSVWEEEQHVAKNHPQINVPQIVDFLFVHEVTFTVWYFCLWWVCCLAQHVDT